ncbi:acyl-CoA thioesterase [Lachnoclostridium sp.]|uniref:acyl-CoA thioesterase n=1 Tax=Lachnoclostridium sp. TaxID=2028282 RepID=UPI002896A8BA|nr:acyl-CoA thioesterase [Lachnoclostridium sp.]
MKEDIKAYQHKVQYYETDQMGIVHHSNYIRWFEEARTDLLEQVGFTYQKMEECGVIIPVIGVNCEYKSMVRFNDIVTIFPRVTEFNGVKLTVAYQITDVATGKLCTVGETKHCFLNSEYKMFRLAKEKLEVYQTFKDLLELGVKKA